MLEANTRVMVTLVPLPGKQGKRVYGRLAADYAGSGPVSVRSGGDVTVVPAERVLLVQTRESGTRPDWIYSDK